MAMLQRPQTYQAKAHVPVVSAAIDPYEEDQNSLVDDEKLDVWFRYVEAELQRYRSPFVAAEALLTELREHSTELYQPERLYVNSALRVLQACVPHLSKETADVVSAAIHELLPCLLYTRRMPLSTPDTVQGSSDFTEQVTQLTYAAAFRRMLQRWQQCRSQLQRQERRVRVEVRVMDRLVHELDHMWVKTCFYSWRTYCRQLQVRKAQLRRRLLRATLNEAAPRQLRAWRQYAHAISLGAKASRNTDLQRQVEALYPLEHEAKSRHDHLTEQIKEKNRLVGESLEKLEDTRERLQVLESLIEETQTSLSDHWAAWRDCMQLLFGDVGTLPGKADRAVCMNYLMNITDTAAALTRRARSTAERHGLRDIGQLLFYENALNMPAYDLHANTRAIMTNNAVAARLSIPAPPPPPLPSSSVSRTRSLTTAATGAAPPGRRHPSQAFSSVFANIAATDVHRVYTGVCAVSHPVLPPLHLMDVLHHNEPHLQLTLAFLSSLYSGGHCSLFRPVLSVASRREGGDAPTLTVTTGGAAAGGGAGGPSARLRAPVEAASPSPGPPTGTTTAALRSAIEEAEKEVREVEWGPRMVQDVARGMTRLQLCTDMNERYLLAVRQCMMSSELEVIHGYLDDLYTRWAMTGVPLSRVKLEAVWGPVISPAELPIVKALYPSQGITCFAELVNYVTQVAEFSGLPLLSLAERLDATYAYDPLDELRIVHRSEEAGELFRAYTPQFLALSEWLKDAGNTAAAAPLFRADRLTAFLEGQLGLSATEVGEVSECVERELGKTVGREGVEWMLLVAAAYVDPSPFTTTFEKVTTLLTQLGFFFAQLTNGRARAPLRKSVLQNPAAGEYTNM